MGKYVHKYIKVSVFLFVFVQTSISSNVFTALYIYYSRHYPTEQVTMVAG